MLIASDCAFLILNMRTRATAPTLAACHRR